MELEVKFLLSKPGAFIERLHILGAHLEKPRVHETNLRFDTPEQALRRSYQVLRLRQDAKVRVTYKGPGKLQGGVRARQEIEFGVDNFDAAQATFEALGYEVSFVYEKYRTTYTLDVGSGDFSRSKATEVATTNRTVEIVFDETPLGTFTEIEGPDAASIQTAAHRLELDWAARINDSYVYLFEKAKLALGLPVRDLTFENFREVVVTPAALGVRFGD
ncbi:MAG: class IV adenylate cyclase [Anaerolineales bacterium]|nr:class IV adenylate cyclase [Anaerolineales bacterium]